MNIMFLVVVALYVWRIFKASRSGLVGELRALIDIIMISASVMFAITMIDSAIHKNLISFLISGIILMALLLIRKVVNFITKSLDVITKLPILNSVNKLLGFFAGILEATLLTWALLAVITTWDLPFVGENIMKEITDNTFLNFIYQNNELSVFTDKISNLNFFEKI